MRQLIEKQDERIVVLENCIKLIEQERALFEKEKNEIFKREKEILGINCSVVGKPHQSWAIGKKLFLFSLYLK